MPEEENVIAQGERSIAVGGQATDNNIYSGDDLSIKIERDAISSAIISGNGNKVVIYQYQLERQVLSEKTSYSGEIGPNPYKGLLAFQSEDGDRYFGREAQIEKLWNLFRALHVLKDDQGAVNSAAFSPDGKLLATGGQDGTAHLWDTSGQLLAVLKSDQGWVKRVAFSPDGKLLATGGQDGTVRLWDTSGKQLVVLKYHQVSVNRQASVDSLVFSPDGKLLATPGKFGTVLWQVGGLDELLAVSCDWVSGYVQTNPNVSDHTLCNDVATQK